MNQNNQHITTRYSSLKEEQMSLWAKKYFYHKLTDQGFVSFQDKGLSWYKVIDQSIIQTVYLFSGTASMLIPELGFGCHPLFIPAPLPQKLVVSGYGRDDVIMSICRFPLPKICYSDSIILQAKSPGAGAELLDEIVFPQLSQIHSIADAYNIHRYSNQKRIERFLSEKSWADYSGWATCREFMDELIYMSDWDMLKYCDRDLSLSLCINDKDRKRVQEQRAAIYDGKRDEFLAMLEKRKKRFITQLEKKVGIVHSI